MVSLVWCYNQAWLQLHLAIAYSDELPALGTLTVAKHAGYIFIVAYNKIIRPKWVGGSGSVVVLSLSSVPEATGSHVHNKNMHTLPACSGPIFFLPISLFSVSLFCIYSDSSSLFHLHSLASASIVSVFYIDADFLHMYVPC